METRKKLLIILVANILLTSSTKSEPNKSNKELYIVVPLVSIFAGAALTYLYIDKYYNLTDKGLPTTPRDSAHARPEPIAPSNQNSSPQQCNICMDGERGTGSVTLSCGHAFCSSQLKHELTSSLAILDLVSLRCHICQTPWGEHEICSVADNDQKKLLDLVYLG